MARQRNINFEKALGYLKRRHRITREQWKNNFFLEIREDPKGNKEIYSSSGLNSSGIRHTFDQNEILANDWVVL